MNPIHRGCLASCLAMACLLATALPTPAQVIRPYRDPQQQFQDNMRSSGGVTFNNGVNNPASGLGAGMIVTGIGLILVGLVLTGGVVYLALQGQKNAYGGRRRRRNRRDDDD